MPMTPTYELGQSDSFNRTIEKLEYGLGPLERVSHCHGVAANRRAGLTTKGLTQLAKKKR